MTAAAFVAGFANPVAAESMYGCEALDQSSAPAVEGASGTFYRIDPDLMMDTRLPDPLIAGIADIAGKLAAQGTRLVYVPVPTKGLVQHKHLGSDVARYGFDVRLARALYADSVTQLRASGITTLDALEILSDGSNNEPAFFKADPRMTNEGLRDLAAAAAAEVGDSHRGQTAFDTTEVGMLELDSPHHFLLQLSCQADLPAVRTRAFQTSPETQSASEPSLAVIGSHITGGDGRNFAGFLAEALQRPVTREIVAEQAHAALARYLTSGQYHEDRPDLIVWLVPIWENPARFGDQPMRELAAASVAECGAPLSAERQRDGRFQFDLDQLSLNSADSLRLDAGNTPVASAVFQFTSSAGQHRARSIQRQSADTATPRAYMPLTGLWADGAASVTIETDAPIDAAPSLSVCKG